MSKNLEKRLCLALAVVSILFSLALYHNSLNYYFFQDDFYEILISKAKNMEEFIQLFAFQENRSSYRPIGLQLYFFISQTLFGLNPTFYRIITFAMFIASYFLIASTVGRLLKNKLSGFITASLWISASIHFLSLSWIAAAWLIVGSFFFFLTSYTFLNYMESKKGIMYLASIGSFLLTLGSFEFFIAWPVIFALYLKFFEKLSFGKVLVKLSPFLLISVLYILARFTYASLPQINEYRVEINLDTSRHLLWYLLWTFNIPEEFKKQVLNNLVVFNPIFLRDFGFIVMSSFVSMMLVLIFGLFAPLIKKLKDNRAETLKLLAFSSIWFLISIVPVIVFPNHSFAMYLAIPSIGIYLLMAKFLASQKNVYISLFVLLVWFYSSFVTVNFYKQTYWVEESQRFAKKFSQDIKSRFLEIPAGSTIYYPISDKRYQQAILNENAIKVLYKDPSIRIFFSKEALNESVAQGLVNPDKILYFENQ